MSAQRARSVIAADHRSALPHVPGLPWWGAMLLAATATAVGFAYDAGTGEKALGAAFSLCYAVGCVLAVLTVRQSGVFSAVIQPPLILFVSVPFAYFVFHGSTITGIKDTLINFGYPLIERFPLMFFTSAAVLLIGMVRWYLGTAARRAIPADAEDTSDDAPVAGLLAAAAASKSAKKTTTARRSARTAADRPDRAAAAAALASAEDSPRPPRRSERTAAAERKPARTSRSRHSLPPETEIDEPVPSRPRRRAAPPVEPPAEPRRRPRATEPRERRPLPPLDRRSAYERPERSDRYERPQRRERPDVRERAERPEYPDRADRQRRPRTAEDAHDSRPPSSSNGSNGSHHPVSRVRYRGSDDGESRTENRTRPRRPRHAEAESWEYDA